MGTLMNEVIVPVFLGFLHDPGKGITSDTLHWKLHQTCRCHHCRRPVLPESHASTQPDRCHSTSPIHPILLSYVQGQALHCSVSFSIPKQSAQARRKHNDRTQDPHLNLGSPKGRYQLSSSCLSISLILSSFCTFIARFSARFRFFTSSSCLALSLA